MKVSKKILILIKLLGIALLIEQPINSQIIPDNSLPQPSTAIPNNNATIIIGGTQRGTNLFHSFEQFSLQTGQAALFNNAPTIRNIFSRVTGADASLIDGLLKTQGNANLFFLNPNGIIFGGNAVINVGGSFLATTADRLVFADGAEFSAEAQGTGNLLTISVPIGLGFTEKLGSITVRGEGHNLLQPQLIGAPPNGIGQSLSGLRILPGRSFVLAANGVRFEGGIITLAGNVAIASVEKGFLGFNANTFSLSEINQIEKWQDIEFVKKSLFDVSSIVGLPPSSILILGKNATLRDGSILISTNFSNSNAGAIKLILSEDFNLQGVSPFNSAELLSLALQDLSIPRGILSLNFSSGKGADISISARNITIQDSGVVSSASFFGVGGNINLSADGSLQVLGKSEAEPLALGSFATTAAVGALGGNVSVRATDLFIRDGAQVTTLSFGNQPKVAQAGSLNTEVSNLIEVSGAIELEPSGFVPTILGSGAVQGANAGEVKIEANQILVGTGGRIDSTTAGEGNAGSLTLKAGSSIIVTGTPGNLDDVDAGQIFSSATPFNRLFSQILQLNPEEVTGNAGNLSIQSPQIELINGGKIGVQNDGTGNAGTLEINTSSIFLTNSSSISATTASGIGGDIVINSRDIRLFNNSNITATAGGTGNGGNILLDTNALVTLEDSNITANAFAGRGGNVQIDAEGVLTSASSDITASSELGIQGRVEIRNPENNLISAIIPVQAQIIEADETVAQACRNPDNQSSFVIKGSGSLTPMPDEVPSRFIQNRLPDLNSEPSSNPNTELNHEYIPPNAIIKTEDGRLLLVNVCKKLAGSERSSAP